MKKHDKKRVMNNYKKVMGTFTEEGIIDGLFESLEEATGMKATKQQKEYVNNYMRQYAMRWCKVITHIEEASEDPEIVAKYKKKVDGKK